MVDTEVGLSLCKAKEGRIEKEPSLDSHSPGV